MLPTVTSRQNSVLLQGALLLFLLLQVCPNESSKPVTLPRLTTEEPDDQLQPDSDIHSDSYFDQPPVGCAETPIGCFGTHRALQSILPVFICILLGGGKCTVLCL